MKHIINGKFLLDKIQSKKSKYYCELTSDLLKNSNVVRITLNDKYHSEVIAVLKNSELASDSDFNVLLNTNLVPAIRAPKIIILDLLYCLLEKDDSHFYLVQTDTIDNQSKLFVKETAINLDNVISIDILL